MRRFRIGNLRDRDSSVWGFYRMRAYIKMDPDYQRQSDIWTREKNRLLVDTIINGFDVPKLYVHKLDNQESGYEYAMIDGKQRAEAIFKFIENEFALDEDFTYIEDKKVKLGGMTYRDLGLKYPEIKQDFDSFRLSVVAVETADIELIEDLFSRLNEAVPLNAAEKRNAKRGPLPKITQAIARHRFFTQKVPFRNLRYRNYDIIAKMLLLSKDRVILDTKKIHLDQFFDDVQDNAEAKRLKIFVEEILELMSDVFEDGDALLKFIGMSPIYFMLFARAKHRNCVDVLRREIFSNFENLRLLNRKKAEEDISDADYELLEFDRLSRSPNDNLSMQYRLAIVDKYACDGELGFGERLENIKALGNFIDGI